MDSLDSKIIIEGIRNQDKKVLQDIYRDYFPTIKKLVVQNNGDSQDAKDVFQEAIIIIYRKVKEEDFELTSSFKSFVYGVCRNLWIKQLSKNKEYKERLNGYAKFEDWEDYGIDDSEYEQHEEYKLFQLHFKRLANDCQKLLQMFLNKVSLKDIAEELGIESVKYIKKKKYKCKEQLVKYIKSDPDFKGEKGEMDGEQI